MPETEAFKELQKRYLADTFNAEHHPDVQRIPEGVSGEYEIRDRLDKAHRWYQELLRGGELVEHNHPDVWQVNEQVAGLSGHVVIENLAAGGLLNAVLQVHSVVSVTVFEPVREIVDLVAGAFFSWGDRVEIATGDIEELNVDLEKQFETRNHVVWKAVF